MKSRVFQVAMIGLADGEGAKTCLALEACVLHVFSVTTFESDTESTACCVMDLCWDLLVLHAFDSRSLSGVSARWQNRNSCTTEVWLVVATRVSHLFSKRGCRSHEDSTMFTTVASETFRVDGDRPVVK